MTVDPTGRAHQVANELFDRHRPVFGADEPVYRGHVHRVIGLVGRQVEVPAELAGVLGLAVFFHDSGIWFDGTWDYLPPSTRRATAALAPADRGHTELVASIIDEHHRLRRAHHPEPIVEAVRRADLTDITAGLVPAPGVSGPTTGRWPPSTRPAGSGRCCCARSGAGCASPRCTRPP